MKKLDILMYYYILSEYIIIQYLLHNSIILSLILSSYDNVFLI